MYLGCVLAFFIALSSHADEQSNYLIYLTGKTDNNVPAQQPDEVFDCTDRIHLVIETMGIEAGKHNLTVRWMNPSGDLQEKTDLDFHSQSYDRIWAWLQLNGPLGSVVTQVFDPSFGMEEFIGEWNALVFIDREQIRSKKFNVLC